MNSRFFRRPKVTTAFVCASDSEVRSSRKRARSRIRELDTASPRNELSSESATLDAGCYVRITGMLKNSEFSPPPCFRGTQPLLRSGVRSASKQFAKPLFFALRSSYGEPFQGRQSLKLAATLRLRSSFEINQGVTLP